MIGLGRGGECRSLFPYQFLITISRSCRTSLDTCADIDCILLDVEERPFWRLVKLD